MEINNMYTKALLYDLIHCVNEYGIIIYNNNRNITGFEDIRIMFRFSKKIWNTYVKKDIDRLNLIRKEKIMGSWKMFLNPIIYPNLVTINEINFSIFEDVIKNNMEELQYLKLASKFKEINHIITCSNISNLVPDISGIYRLYKNNKIVYIGKSICIKTRLKQHIKEKNIDGFDFTILSNESNKNIYELYYIDKYKPIFNKDCIEESISDICLKKLVFSEFIPIKT